MADLWSRHAQIWPPRPGFFHLGQRKTGRPARFWAFEPARTRSSPGSGPDQPDLLLAQIAFFWSRSKIDPDQRKSDLDQRKSDLDQRKSDPDQRKSDMGQVQNSSGPDDPVHSGPDFSGTKTRSGLRSRPGLMPARRVLVAFNPLATPNSSKISSRDHRYSLAEWCRFVVSSAPL